MYNTKLIKNLNNSDYHNDKSYYSSTDLRNILKSPKHYLHSLQGEKKQTACMLLGSVVHTLILEGAVKFYERYIITPDLNKNTIKYKEWLLENNKENKIVISKEYEDIAYAMRTELIKTDYLNKTENEVLNILNLIPDNNIEVSIFSEYIYEEKIIKVKARPDAINLSKGIIIDYKTTSDDILDTSTYRKAFFNFKYHVQAQHYLNLCKNAFPAQGEWEVIHIVQSKNPPYLARVFKIHENILTDGQIEINKALEIIVNCEDLATFDIGYDIETNYQVLNYDN